MVGQFGSTSVLIPKYSKGITKVNPNDNETYRELIVPNLSLWVRQQHALRRASGVMSMKHVTELTPAALSKEEQRGLLFNNVRAQLRQDGVYAMGLSGYN